MTCVSGAGWGQQVWHHLSRNHKNWKWRSCKRQSAEEGRERGAAEDTRRRSKEEERRRRRNEPTEWEWNVCEESEGVQCLHGFKTPLSLGTRWIQTAPRWNFTGLILEPWRRRTSRRVFFFSRILNWIASLNDSCREIPWTHTPVLEVWWEPVSEVCVRLHVSLQTEEFHELCCTSVIQSVSEIPLCLPPTHQQPAAWQHMSDVTHRTCCCVESVHVNESEICSMFQPCPLHGYKHTECQSASSQLTSSGEVQLGESLHARSSSASLSADRDACSFSLGEFHLELLQPSRSDNPTALNSARCWKCYGDVTAATLSLWRQDFMENRLWRFFRPETER